MSRKTAFVRVGLVVFSLAVATSLASAQALNSGSQSININAKLSESLTLSLDSNSVSIPLTANTASNPSTTTVTATTKWVLKKSRTAVTVDAYFASATDALDDGASDLIPSSAFSIQNNGGSFNALTNTVAFGAANAGLRLENITISSGNANYEGSSIDAMNFNINTTGALAALPAATYTGQLNIQAQATP